MQILGNSTSPVQGGIGNRDNISSEINGFLGFISNPETSIPLNSNFVVQFSLPSRVILSTSEENGFSKWELKQDDWNSLASKRDALVSIHRKNFVGDSVSVFANGIVLPQETVNVQRGESFNNGGLISGVFSTSRAQQGVLKTTILETELSFIDFIIRPWVMLTSHLGLLARGDNGNVKTDITAYFFSKFPNKDGNGLKLRKIYKFYGCAPVAIEGSYASHDFGKNDMTVARVDWVYNYYTVSVTDRIPVIRTA